MGGIIPVAAWLGYVDIIMQTLLSVILRVCSNLACTYLSSLLVHAALFQANPFEALKEAQTSSGWQFVVSACCM